jgi:hypothetical protein
MLGAVRMMVGLRPYKSATRREQIAGSVSSGVAPFRRALRGNIGVYSGGLESAGQQAPDSTLRNRIAQFPNANVQTAHHRFGKALIVTLNEPVFPQVVNGAVTASRQDSAHRDPDINLLTTF